MFRCVTKVQCRNAVGVPRELSSKRQTWASIDQSHLIVRPGYSEQVSLGVPAQGRDRAEEGFYSFAVSSVVRIPQPHEVVVTPSCNRVAIRGKHNAVKPSIFSFEL